MSKFDLDDLKNSFSSAFEDRCSNEDGCDTDSEDDEISPIFVEVLNQKLLAPSISGVYLSRLDIKRVAENIDESIPIKERAKMIKTLFRHTNSKEFLQKAFDEINRHINARIYLYEALAADFPASSKIFEDYVSKAKKMQKNFDKMVEDFEVIEPTDEPMLI